MRAVETSSQCSTERIFDLKKRSIPIEALEMLTQRVPQIHCDYLQPHGQTSDTKTSPLALLAATCSSIGKTELDKGRETNPKTTSPKVTSRSDDPKSSFKPYKQELSKMTSNSLPKLQMQSDGIFYSTAPTSTGNPGLFCHGRYPGPGGLSQTDVEKERFNCGSTFFDGSRDMHPAMANMKCHTSPSLTPVKSHMQVPHHHPHEHECTQCAAIRAASESSMSQNASVVAAAAAAAAARNASICPCGYCAQMRPPSEIHAKSNGQLCQFQSSGSMYPNFKAALPSAGSGGCRDPHCTNCAKISQPAAGLQNYIHPALLHQCTHGKGVPSSYPGVPNASLHSSLIPENFVKTSVNTTSQPFICNWVSENKHCGKSFASSEELLQHLRTHTSLSQNNNSQRQSPCASVHDAPAGPLASQMQAQCNIHGCPCKLNTSASRPNPIHGSYSPYVSPSSAALRYHPYGRIPTLPGSSSAYPHSYLPHSLLHY